MNEIVWLLLGVNLLWRGLWLVLNDATFYFFSQLTPPPPHPLTGELHKSIPCQCPCTVNGWLRYSTSRDHHWWSSSRASISLHARLGAADVLTRPQWKEQLGVRSHEEVSALVLTHVCALAAPGWTAHHFSPNSTWSHHHVTQNTVWL